MNSTFEAHYTSSSPLLLKDILSQFNTNYQKCKCRIVYNEKEYAVTQSDYVNPVIDALKIVTDDSISYPFKASHRDQLTHAYQQRESAADIIIIKEGKVTDSYFANLAFFDGRRWWTPDQPLLKGTKRAFLLNQGVINEKKIGLTEIKNFKKISLINAMLDLNEISLDISKIMF